MINYDFRYIEHKRPGYYGAQYAARQVSDAVRLSTYDEQLSWPSPRHRKAIIGICLITLALLTGVVEMGLLDGIYVWLAY